MTPVPRLFIAPGCLAVTFMLCTGALAQTTAPSTPLAELQNHLAKMKPVTTLALNFVCEKRLAALESPLVSEGRLWIQKNADQSAAVRFSTEKPYLSELILINNKIYARSQHEKTWTVTDQATRPGLALVMMQLGGWSTGEPGTLADSYDIVRAPAGTTLPKLPATGGSGIGTTAPRPEQNKDIDIYILTPKSKEMKAAVKSIAIALDHSTSFLLSVEIITKQDDATRYWFLNPQLNTTLPADTFTAK